MLEVKSLDIAGVKVAIPRKFSDERGFFSETYNQKTFSEAGIADTFVQDNHSYSVGKGVIRGLHFQVPPMHRPSWCAWCAVRCLTWP